MQSSCQWGIRRRAGKILKNKKINHRGTEDTEKTKTERKQKAGRLFFSVFLFSVSSVPLWLIRLLLLVKRRPFA
jgi:hypothetical protein